MTVDPMAILEAEQKRLAPLNRVARPYLEITSCPTVQVTGTARITEDLFLELAAQEIYSIERQEFLREVEYLARSRGVKSAKGWLRIYKLVRRMNRARITTP